MSAAKKLMERMKSKAAPDLKRSGVLPLRAFYGRDPEREILRDRMYASIGRVMSADERGVTNSGRYQVQSNVFIGEGSASVFNAGAAPIEYLVMRGEMATDRDDEGMAGARFHTAIKLRQLFDGAQRKGMKSPSIDGMGGGGSGGTVDISGYQIDCIRKVGRLAEEMVSPWLFDLVRNVVWMDEWYDLNAPDKMPKWRADERMETIFALHFGLDVAAVTLGYEMEGCLTVRWEATRPKMPSSVSRRNQGTMAPDPLSLRT